MTEFDATTFADEVRAAGEAISPARAGLLLARELAYPTLRPSEYLTQLDDLAREASSALHGQATSTARGLALADYLFRELGFEGNKADYSDPRNSFLNEVLDRRLGIPISLSVIFLEVGWRLKLPVQGVGLPGHFIVAVMGEDSPHYLDPFNGGRELSLADCADLVHRSAGLLPGSADPGAFDMDWLAPTPTPDIVARMLNNLRVFYATAEDWPMAIGVMERLRELQPGVSTHLRDLGVLHYRAGHLRRASDFFSQYLTREPNAPDVDSVRQGRDLLLEQLARLN